MGLEPEIKGKLLIRLILILTIFMDIIIAVVHELYISMFFTALFTYILFGYILRGREWARTLMGILFSVGGIAGIVLFILRYLSGEKLRLFIYVGLQSYVVLILAGLTLLLSGSVKAYLLGYREFYAERARRARG
ncbi:MAG: hypothetical protein OEZ36_01010 [Spirochaetota bacterium]|nr:hypothetical protein [Spirochaetota bacterium]